MKRILTILIFLVGAQRATLGYSFSDEQFYRDLTLKIRPKGSFKIPMPLERLNVRGMKIKI